MPTRNNSKQIKNASRNTKKKRVVSKAKQAGLTTGEYMRRAAEGYQSMEDVVSLEAMIEQLNKVTESASRAVDDALVFVAESNQHIKKLEVGAKRAAV